MEHFKQNNVHAKILVMRRKLHHQSSISRVPLFGKLTFLRFVKIENIRTQENIQQIP